MEVLVESQDILVSELNSVRDTIENMSKFNQVEILRILSKHKEITLNENKYGVHINLTDLTSETLNQLKSYINYVNTQEITLHQVEQKKEAFKNIYFTKDNKDSACKTSK